MIQTIGNNDNVSSGGRMASDSQSANTPQEIYAFVKQVIEKFHAKGLNAMPLQRVQSTAYTTGNEWRGELIAAIKEIQKIQNCDGEIARDLEILTKRIKKLSVGP